MLMVFVGPLVSQSQRMLENHGPIGDQPPTIMHGTSHARADMAMHDADDLAACGYCTLFSHTPGIDPTPGSLPPAGAIARPHAALTSVSGPLQLARYLRFTPRAPPQFLAIETMS